MPTNKYGLLCILSMSSIGSYVSSSSDLPATLRSQTSREPSAFRLSCMQRFMCYVTSDRTQSCVPTTTRGKHSIAFWQVHLGTLLDLAPADQPPMLLNSSAERDLLALLGADRGGELQLCQIVLDLHSIHGQSCRCYTLMSRVKSLIHGRRHGGAFIWKRCSCRLFECD